MLNIVPTAFRCVEVMATANHVYTSTVVRTFVSIETLGNSTELHNFTGNRVNRCFERLEDVWEIFFFFFVFPLSFRNVLG